MTVIEAVETKDVSLDELMPFPGNAKRGDIPKIRESLRRLGQYRALVVRKLTNGELMILAGNNTFLAMREEGWGSARCEIITCDDDAAARINVNDNAITERGTYDDRALAEILASLDGDYEGLGLDQVEIDDLFKKTDFFTDTATEFLDELIDGPAGATHRDPDEAVPLVTGRPVPGADKTAPDATTPAAGATINPGYVPLSYMVLPEDREIVRSAVTRYEAVNGGTVNAADAIVAISRHYLDTTEVAA